MTVPNRHDEDDDTDFPLPDRSADVPADGVAEDDPFADAPAEENPFDLGADAVPPPPPADPFGVAESDAEEADTYSFGEATVPPKWGEGLNPSRAELEPESAPKRPRRPAQAAPAAPPADGDEDDEDYDDAPATPRRAKSKSGSAKPKLRDWLEERCKKEAKMYALGAAVLAPIGLVAVGLTWLVLSIIVPGDGVIEWLLATIGVAALFWVNKQAGDARTIRVQVDPGDRDIKPVTVDVPRGSGLTWLMYLTGSRELPGILQFLGTVTLFGPRLCDLALQMGRTAQKLWTIDIDALANPLKTLVRAEGKVSFAAFFEKHSTLSPQGLVRRLGRIDGVLFLPTSQPPGLCVSNAMKDEFAAWRVKWQERRAAGERLYD